MIAVTVRINHRCTNCRFIYVDELGEPWCSNNVIYRGNIRSPLTVDDAMDNNECKRWEGGNDISGIDDTQ